jgi:hypothetical protein
MRMGIIILLLIERASCKAILQRQNQKANMISWLNSPSIIYRLKNLVFLIGNLLFNFLYLFLSFSCQFLFYFYFSFKHSSYHVQLAIPISSNYSNITIIGFRAKQHVGSDLLIIYIKEFRAQRNLGRNFFFFLSKDLGEIEFGIFVVRPGTTRSG